MIYLHIPFCKQQCSYCNFHFSTSFRGKDEMVAAMKKEIFLRRDELVNKTLSSVYFGGGTPSVLEPSVIKSLLDEIQKYFTFEEKVELTLEANPDDLHQNFLRGLASTGINRLSIGTQSFFDEDLKMMNRAHTASEAEDSIKRAQDFGFENISIDLIYGAPTADFEIWKENLNRTVALQVPHISSYALTVEPRTPLNHWINRHKIQPPNEDDQNRNFFYMTDFLKDNGFDHYEISNFGKPGFHSQHNSNYWKYREYLGIGPSAHSYNGTDRRSWNIANNKIYTDRLLHNTLAKETEVLSEKDRFNEMLMIGLRTSAGVDLNRMNKTFSTFMMEKLESGISEKLAAGILFVEKNYLKIAEKHWFMADGIAADLFWV